MIGASRRVFSGIGVLAFFQAAVWAQSVPLVGDTYILPGSGINVGGTVTVSVGGASGFQGLFLFDLSRGRNPPSTGFREVRSLGRWSRAQSAFPWRAPTSIFRSPARFSRG